MSNFQLTSISATRDGRYITIKGTYWAPNTEAHERTLALVDNEGEAAMVANAIQCAAYFTGQGRPVIDLDLLEVANG